MKRQIISYLVDWKFREHRKPLIVRGARQVGKTYAVEHFGSDHFGSVVKINFEENPDMKSLFETNAVLKTIRNLEIITGQKIDTKTTLLFLDEIQNCPEAIVSLRYFYEKIPELCVIAAGSLLDFTLNDMQYSMPVGRVEFAYMYPMNFNEFLSSMGEEQLADYLKTVSIDNIPPDALHNKLMELIRLYFVVGGMPEAVNVFSETKSLTEVERIHESIIRSFEFDFSKYGSRNQQNRMVKLVRYIPKAIGQKFKYSNFDNTERSDTIRKSLNLLSMARIMTLIFNTKASGLPLENYLTEKTFKPLFLDIGLLNHILKLRINDIDKFDVGNIGNLSEQFIGQELLCSESFYRENDVFYWMREKRNSEAEIDYVIQYGKKIVPIEVKAGKSGTLKSLQVFVSEKRIEQAFRFNADKPSKVKVQTSVKINNSMQNVDFELVSLPLYLIKELKRFVESDD